MENNMHLEVDLSSKDRRRLVLANPVIAASGTFGYGTEYEHLFDIQRLGALVCKGTTLKPREGNPQPRIAESPSGVLNSIGLQNIGVEALLKEKTPVWATWRVPVLVNIAGESVEDYARLAARLDGVKGVSGIEVNISCPNVEKGGAEFGAQPESAARVTAAVRQATSLPVWVKLTPNTADIKKIASAVADAGADAVVLINTLKGMAIDIKKRRPVLGNITGGLSGPAIKPVALRMVWEVAGVISLPVIGCGGILTAQDALEFIMAGATAVEVGMVNLIDPQAPADIIKGIEDFMVKGGLSDIRELVGAARK
jgi:dihydroorotate dehydrogenase (NAD+) catalytic subunit